MKFFTTKKTKYDSVFSGLDGKFVLGSLMDVAGFFKSSFSPGDPHQTSYNEGKRAIALHLIQILGITEQDAREMVRAYREDMQEAEQDNNYRGY